MWASSKKENPSIARDKSDQNKRLAKTLFIVTILSLIAWIPLAVVTVFPSGERDNGCLPIFNFVGIFLQLANSAINPAVYCYCMSEFRAILKQNVLKCGNTIANIPSVRGRYKFT